MNTRPNVIPRRLKYKFNLYWLLDYFFGSFAGPRFHAKCVSVNREIRDYLLSLPKGRVMQPEVYENISPEYFHKHVLPKGKPAILRGLAKDWPCSQKWTPEYFAEKYKGYELVVTNLHADRGGENELVAIEQYVDEIKAGERKYARFSKIMHDHPGLKDDFDMKKLMAHKKKTDFWVATQFFMGPPTTFTHIHCAFINNLFVQAYGRKRWRIYSPQYNALFMPPVDRAPTFRTSSAYERVPEGQSIFDHMDHYDFMVEQGDVLYNPPFHWHYVTNHTMSISLSFRIFSVFNAVKASPMLGFLTAVATNPPALAGLYGTWRAKNFLNFYDKKGKIADAARAIQSAH
jgi:hypothetical protein